MGSATVVETDQVDWLNVVFTLLGGIALFLFGLKLLGNAIKEICGPKMKETLAMLSSNK